jgi:hypothetical protein
MTERPTWVTAATDAIEQFLTGAHRTATWCWHAGHVYLRTCPVKGCRWYWRTIGYGTWSTAAAFPLAVGGVLLVSAGPLAWGIAGATLVAVCWIAGEDEDEEEEPEAEEEPAPAAPIDPLLAFTAQLIGNARGIHLTALLTALHRAGVDPRFDATELRTVLAEQGVAWRPSVRAPKGAVPGAAERVAQGVHREDLEAVIGPFPVPSSEPLPGPVATATTSGVTCDVADLTTAVATGRSSA